MIALGEATHGNAEFQQLKMDVFQIMVDYYGVRSFALETDTTELEKIWDNEESDNIYTEEQKTEAINAVKAQILDNEGPEVDQVLHFADILLQNIEVGKAMENGQEGMALRDKYMAENVMWILEQEEARGNKRIFISGHNGHVDQFGSYDKGNKYMGHILADNIGEASYFVIGTDFYKTKNNMPKNGEKRTTFAVYSHDPFAKAAKNVGIVPVGWIFQKYRKNHN